MALNLTDALNQYGFVGTLANSIPELKGIFEQAAREEWDPARFERAVMDSTWYRGNADSVRQLVTLQATDPATYNQNLVNASHKVVLLSRQMGRTVDTGGIAWQALLNNWDDEQIRSAIGMSGTLSRENGALMGQAAQLQTHMAELAQNYGVSYTQSFLDTWTNAVESGHNTLDGYEALIRARAVAAFPQFADQINAGMTVRDIADPYISTMANTLEISETELDLHDASVKRALSARQPDGSMGSQPLWEFERQLKDDPRWDKTKQARTQAFDTIAQVGRDFGFEAGAA